MNNTLHNANDVAETVIMNILRYIDRYRVTTLFTLFTLYTVQVDIKIDYIGKVNKIVSFRHNVDDIVETVIMNILRYIDKDI